MIFNRPWIVLVQVVAGLFFTAISIIRFASALSLYSFLIDLPLAVSPAYQSVSGLVWGGAGLWVSVWLWIGHRKAPAALRILAVTYALYYWIDQIILMTSEIRSTNWPFLALVTAVLLLLVFLSFRPSAVKAYFGEKNER